MNITQRWTRASENFECYRCAYILLCKTGRLNPFFFLQHRANPILSHNSTYLMSSIFLLLTNYAPICVQLSMGDCDQGCHEEVPQPHEPQCGWRRCAGSQSGLRGTPSQPQTPQHRVGAAIYCTSGQSKPLRCSETYLHLGPKQGAKSQLTFLFYKHLPSDWLDYLCVCRYWGPTTHRHT